MAYSQSFIQQHSRKLIGVGIILVALIAASGLAGQADTSVSMWGAKYSLSSGATIKAADLKVVKVSLGDQAPKYFSNKAKLVGNYLTKNLAEGELIPVSAVTKTSSGVTLKQIPLGIGKSDLPSNLHVGDLVDLYSLPTKDPKASTTLVTSKVRVAAIDSQSQNMGGVVNLLLSVEKEFILDITDAIQIGRIVVVRNAI